MRSRHQSVILWSLATVVIEIVGLIGFTYGDILLPMSSPEAALALQVAVFTISFEVVSQSIVVEMMASMATELVRSSQFQASATTITKNVDLKAAKKSSAQLLHKHVTASHSTRYKYTTVHDYPIPYIINDFVSGDLICGNC
eukprot:jgi/Hompol1/3674/HPOL_006680-RA